MAFLADISFRRALGLLVLALGILLGGTWLTAKVLTDHLLNSDAEEVAFEWAGYLAGNVPDLAQIASGEQPSTTSMAFFQATRKAGQVYRYVIFNKEGYSQLVSDRTRIAPVDISEFSAQAALAAKSKQPVVDVNRSGGDSTQPTYFAEAFVPVIINGQAVATVAAFVDQTAQRSRFYYDFLLASVALCALTGLSFGVPAIAWYRRTQGEAASRPAHPVPRPS